MVTTLARPTRGPFAEPPGPIPARRPRGTPSRSVAYPQSLVLGPERVMAGARKIQRVRAGSWLTGCSILGAVAVLATACVSDRDVSLAGGPDGGGGRAPRA